MMNLGGRVGCACRQRIAAVIWESLHDVSHEVKLVEWKQTSLILFAILLDCFALSNAGAVETDARAIYLWMQVRGSFGME